MAWGAERMRTDPSWSGPQIVVFGEGMLELSGPLLGRVQQGYGGDALNTAIYLARCLAGQGEVRFVSALGTDPLSEALLRRWAEEGLMLDWGRRLPGHLPGLYQIELDDQGERRFHYWRQSSAARSFFDQPEHTVLECQLQPAQLFYVSGIGLAILPPLARQRLLDLMARHRRAGGRVALDSNYRPALWEDPRTAAVCMAQAYRCADVALVSLEDQARMLGLDPQAARESALKLGCPELVLKQGGEAAWVREGPGAPWQTVPTVPVAQVVDTTAAGDAFAAAYLHARLCGAGGAQAVRAAHALAARVIQHPGALMPRA